MGQWGPKHVTVGLLNHFCNSNKAYTFVGHTATIIHSHSPPRKHCNKGCLSFRTGLATGIHVLRESRAPLVLLCGTQKHTCILTSVFLDHIPLQFCLRHRLRGRNKRYTIASWHLENHDMPNDRVAFISKGKQDCCVLKTKPIRSLRNVGSHWSHPGDFNPQQYRCHNQHLSQKWCCLETGIQRQVYLQCCTGETAVSVGSVPARRQTAKLETFINLDQCNKYLELVLLLSENNGQ
jgi:hypothetical protein